MATVKSTYSLDEETLKKLQALARAWRISKTEVLRRAIRAAAERELPRPVEERIAALRALRQSLREHKVNFDKWMRDTRRGRR
jgi:predicted transcriptional regulator